jgi:hypothetical protein
MGLADAVSSLARARGIPALGVRLQVARLLTDQVLIDQRLRNPWRYVVLVPLALQFTIAAFAARDYHAWPGLLLYLGVVVTFVWPYFRSASVVLTDRALVIDGYVFDFSQLSRVSIFSTWSKTKPYRLEIGAQRFNLPRYPDELVAVLRERGVTIDAHGCWWS